MKIHHIGYMVKEIGKAVRAFEDLGYRRQGLTVYDSYRESEICFMEQAGYCVELIAPEKTSPLYSLLKRYKNTAYHICYQVQSLRDGIKEFEEKGYKVFREPEAAPAIGKTAEVVFLMSVDIGIVELLEIR